MNVVPDGENHDNSTYRRMPIKPPHAIGGNSRESFDDMRFAHGATELESIMANEDFGLITQDVTTLKEALNCLLNLASTFKPILYRIKNTLCLAVCANTQEVIFTREMPQNDKYSGATDIVLRDLASGHDQNHSTIDSPPNVKDTAVRPLTEVITQVNERLPKITSEVERERLLRKLMSAIASHAWY